MFFRILQSSSILLVVNYLIQPTQHKEHYSKGEVRNPGSACLFFWLIVHLSQMDAIVLSFCLLVLLLPSAVAKAVQEVVSPSSLPPFGGSLWPVVVLAAIALIVARNARQRRFSIRVRRKIKRKQDEFLSFFGHHKVYDVTRERQSRTKELVLYRIIRQYNHFCRNFRDKFGSRQIRVGYLNVSCSLLPCFGTRSLTHSFSSPFTGCACMGYIAPTNIATSERLQHVCLIFPRNPSAEHGLWHAEK